MLLPAFSVRSERQFIEQLDVDLPSRWSVRLGVDAPVWIIPNVRIVDTPPIGGS